MWVAKMIADPPQAFMKPWSASKSLIDKGSQGIHNSLTHALQEFICHGLNAFNDG